MSRLNVLLLFLLLSVWQNASANQQITKPITQMQNATSVPLQQFMSKDPVVAIQSAITQLNRLTLVAEHYPQAIHLLINKEIAPLFDFDSIAEQVLWVIAGRLEADEKAFFTDRLRKNIISTLLSKLTQNKSVSFQFMFAKPMRNGNIAVLLQVNGISPFGVYVDLLFHQDKNKNWRIFDIVLNRDSLIDYYQKMVLIKVRRYGIYEMLERI